MLIEKEWPPTISPSLENHRSLPPIRTFDDSKASCRFNFILHTLGTLTETGSPVELVFQYIF